MRFQEYLFSVSSDDVSVFTSMRFHLYTLETTRFQNDAFSNTLLEESLRSFLDKSGKFKRLLLLKPFSKVFVFISVFGRFSVDERRNTSKCMRFQTKTH